MPQDATGVEPGLGRRDTLVGALAAGAVVASAGRAVRSEPMCLTDRLNLACDAEHIADLARRIPAISYEFGMIAACVGPFAAEEEARLAAFQAGIGAPFRLLLTAAIRSCLGAAMPMAFSFARQDQWAVRVRDARSEARFFIRGPAVL